MGTVTKLNPTGIHYSGEIDEATFNSNSGYTKNLATWSEQFTNPVWSSITRAGILANTDIAPDAAPEWDTQAGSLKNPLLDYFNSSFGNFSSIYLPKPPFGKFP
jgi:hypothetical protein